MRSIVTLLLITSAVAIHAQCITAHLGLTPPDYRMCTFDARLVDGGTLVGFKEQAANQVDVTRDVRLYRTDAVGNITWSHRLVPANPKLSLWPFGLQETVDGGIVVYGKCDVERNYQHTFIVKMDAQGRVEWSRLYMTTDTLWSANAVQAMMSGADELVELGEGGFHIWTSKQHDAWHSIKVDANGIPTASRVFHYSSAARMINDEGSVLLDPDGSVYFTATSVVTVLDSLDLWQELFHVTPQGDLDWSTAMLAMNHDAYGGFKRAANGDLVLMGHPQAALLNWDIDNMMVRLDANGTVLWAKHYDDEILGNTTDIVELSNGDLVIGGWDAMMHTDADGVPVGRWLSGDLGRRHHLRTRNDSVLICRSVPFYPIGPGPWGNVDHIRTAPTMASMSSCLTSMFLPGYSPLSLSQTSTSFVQDSISVKSWPFLMMEADPNSCDILPYMTGFIPRPGFAYGIWGSLENLAGLSGGPMDVTITVAPEVTLDPGSITPLPTSVVGNTITWNDLQALEGFDSWVGGIMIPGTVSPDTLLLGTTISSTITVVQDSVESNIVNNTYTLNQIVTGSYDPNDKLVRTSSGLNDAEFYPGIDEWLDYTIRFQNTGTDTAFTVVVTDTLPAELSTGTMNILSASHPYTYEFGGNGVLRFTFNDILLPDSNVNEPLSHGLVSFRIQPDDGLVVGTVIANRADIFFDFNPPIRTPDALVTISMPTALPELHSEELLIYPVPVREVLLAQLPEGFAVRRVEVLSADGRLVYSPNLSPLNNRLDVGTQGLVPGVYLLSVEGVKGQRLTARFVKE